MKIIAVDDEKPALECLIEAVRAAMPEAKVYGFRYGADALAFAREDPPDVAFLDIEMSEMNGVGLAARLKECNPDVNIVFATGHESYRDAAFDLHASGYLTKPITPQKVARELNDLRRPVAGKRLRVHAFGNFEAYCDGKPLLFRYSKAKELLAYLIDRKGALCTVGEMMAILFEEDEGRETYFKSIRGDLLKTMESIGAENAIVRQHGKLGVAPEEIECDYFDFLEGKASGKRAWRGEYMAQYSWAETTCAFLEKKSEKEE